MNFLETSGIILWLGFSLIAAFVAYAFAQEAVRAVWQTVRILHVATPERVWKMSPRRFLRMCWSEFLDDYTTCCVNGVTFPRNPWKPLPEEEIIG